ncbi:hypothetical protein ABT320_09830 [Streptomyces cellulosae]
MTALDAGTSAGKSTRDSVLLPPGDATRALALPQIPYADAVYAALLAVGLQPSAYEAGLRRGRTGAPELYVRAVWPAGAPALADRARSRGLTVAWSHVTGWAAHDVDEQCALLPVDALAAPELVADAARHHAAHGIDPDQPWARPADGRWTDAVYLDIALTRFDERPGGW